MKKVAIMIDGGFFHKRANYLWGSEATAKERADQLIKHCLMHLNFDRKTPMSYVGYSIMTVCPHRMSYIIRSQRSRLTYQKRAYIHG